MVGNRVYIEGGGNRDRDRVLRRAFGAFFENADLQERLPRIVAGHSRTKTYRGFCKAHSNAGKGDFVALLVDAESAVRPGATGWDHFRERKEDQWARPAGANDDQVHLMVECMEAWFLADRKCLATYFKSGFNARALPGQDNVEAIPKKDLFAGLKNATRNTKKGPYDKGKHSFEILEMLNPELVCHASPHAHHLIDVLRQKL